MVNAVVVVVGGGSILYGLTFYLRFFVVDILNAAYRLVIDI